MNKFGMVIGVAAVAAIAGCKDPDYNRGGDSQNKPTTVVEQPTPAATTTTTPGVIEVKDAPVAKCRCAPGTRHTKPCTCGAPDYTCTVEEAPVATPAPEPVVAEPETTIYIVQSGDYLAKISKKFNVTISSIKRLNPSIGEKNIVRVGQKIKLPGKIDVGVQKEPAKAVAAKSLRKPYAPYAGATKEYVVKNGDTHGAIAYANGISIRQLKELNGLSKDMLRIGQKLKIPAEKVVAAKPAKPAVVAEKKAVAAKPAKPAAAPAPAAPAADDAAPAAAEPAQEAAPAAEAQPAPAPAVSADETPETTTYVVQEGDDITGVSIRFGVSAAVIRELNNLGDNDQLVPGQIIKLPAYAQQ